MSDRKIEAEPDAKVLADLSALADGTIDPRRAEIVRELIATSPELRERYERERLAVDTLQELRSDRAPAALRISIDARRHRVPKKRGRLLYGAALGAAVAAVAALLVLLPGGPGAPSISQAAALATRGPTFQPPAEQGGKLGADVQDTYFPNWRGPFQWRAAGMRVDRLGGHLAMTVYYTDRLKQRIAYTILAMPPLRRTTAPTTHVNGVALQSFVQDGRLVVTWRRGDHTCVLSGSGVSAATLAKLATWEPGDH
jgi:hypothetical protein